MKGYTATTLAYVRTSAGVVKVAAGGHVPVDALPDEVTRLAGAGSIVEAAGEDEGDVVTPTLEVVGDLALPAAPRGGRGRSGSSKPNPSQGV